MRWSLRDDVLSNVLNVLGEVIISSDCVLSHIKRETLVGQCFYRLEF